MRRRIWLLALVLGMAHLAFAEEGLVFHASFDKDTKAEVALGGGEPPYLAQVKTAAGKKGNAAVVPKGAMLIYEGLGNAFVAAGTVGFFWRPDNDPAGQSFIVLDLSPLERINYSRWMRLSCTNDTLDLFCTLGHLGQRGPRTSAGKFKAGEWRHVALAWDQTRGVGIYLDGKLAAQVKEPWTYEGNVNHIGLGISTRADFRPNGADFSQSYDELRVYDRWLDDAAVAALARGETPKLKPLDDRPYLATKRKLYGWTTPGGAGEVPLALGPDAVGVGLRQAGVAKARDVKRSSWRTFDGERGRRWPGGAGYYNAGQTLDIQLHPGETFDVVQVLGCGPLRLVAVKPQEDTLFDLKETALGTWRTVLPKPAVGPDMAVRREAGVIYQMNLFQRLPADALALSEDQGWRRTRLVPAAGQQTAEEVKIAQTFYTPDRTALVCGDAAGQGRLKLPAMRATHILGPAHAERQGLAAAALDLAVVSGAAPGFARVEAIEPLNPERYWATADLALTGATPGRLRVLLDFRDMVLPAKARPRLVLTLSEDAEVDLESSTVAWRWVSVEQALPQHAADQLARGRDIFQEISESRPWGHNPKRLKTLGMLRNVIEDLKSLKPDDPVVLSYWHWINPHEQKALMKPPDVPAGTPAWAVYLDAAIPLLKRVPYWWIENRENDSGEFGANDGVNDDTDLVQDWWAMHLMRGPDRRLFDSLKRVADNSWKRTMQETGLGHFTDTLHTYEDGMNAQCHMALMDYGNPVYFERLLASARHYKDLMGVNAAGHLHFRGSWYGYGQGGKANVDTKGKAYDAGWNALTLQPAMLLGWYNGNAYCRKTLKDWTDAMMAHDMAEYEKTKKIAGCSVRFDTDEATPSRSFGYGFFDAPWVCYEFTGDKKYLDFIKLGMLAEIAGYRRPRQTGTVADRYIQETGDQSLKDRFAADAGQPDHWKGSLHNDNYYELDAFYLAWQCTGDIKFINEGVKLTLNDITWELPMLTEGEQSTDRVWTPQRLVNRVALGGPAMLRNELFPKLAASWEGATGRVAPFVKSQDRKHVAAWLCNLEDRPVEVIMRLWRLDHGQYAVREGLDADQDGKLDGPARERSAELARFSTLPVSLPAKAVWLISMNQTKALDDVTARPDLAVCADDARYDPEAGVLTVVVHSIGAKPTGPFRLRATAGGKTLLDRKDMASLEAPADLNPRTVAVRIEGLKGLEKTPVVIELDPDGVIAEITEANNRVEVTPANAPRPEKAAKPAAAQAYLTSNQ